MNTPTTDSEREQINQAIARAREQYSKDKKQKVNITISQSQKDFIAINNLNLSLFVRDKLNDLMRAK